MALAVSLLAMPLFMGFSALLYGRLSWALMDCAQRHGRFGPIEPGGRSGRGRPVRGSPLRAHLAPVQACAT
jgi:hypothetical protein